MILDLRNLPIEERLDRIDHEIDLYCDRAAVCAGYVTPFAAWRSEQHQPVRWSRDANAAVKLIEFSGEYLETCFYDDDDADWCVRLFGGKGVCRRSFPHAICVALLTYICIEVKE